MSKSNYSGNKEEEKSETENYMLEEFPISLISNPSSEMSIGALLELENQFPRTMEDFDKIFEDEE